MLGLCAVGLCAAGLCACGGELDGDEERLEAAKLALSGVTFELKLFNKDVGCTPYGFYCYEGSSLAQPEELRGAANVKPSVAFPQTGLRTELTFTRASGRLGVLLLDLPRVDAISNANKMELRYEERDGEGNLTFESWVATGTVEIPQASCSCDDIRFELRFVGPGPDGRIASADDAIRRVNAGVLGSNGVYCKTPVSLPLDTRPEVIERTCGNSANGGGGSSGSGGGGGSGGSGGGGIDYDGTSVALSEGCAEACSSTDGCVTSDEGCDDADEGCDGSGGSCEGDQGCEGGSSGGCEGDSSDGGCEGDSDSACALGVLKRVRIHNGFMMLVLLSLLFSRSGWRRLRRRCRRRAKRWEAESAS